METLIKELQESGMDLQQIKHTLTIISRWTNVNYPIMGTVVENILKKNQLLEHS